MKKLTLVKALIATGCMAVSSAQAAYISFAQGGSLLAGADINIDLSTTTGFTLDVSAMDLLDGSSTDGTTNFTTNGGGLIITYDPSVFTVNSAAISNPYWGPIFSNVDLSTPGEVNVMAAHFLSNDPIGNPSGILTLDVSINAGAAAGSYAFGILPWTNTDGSLDPAGYWTYTASAATNVSYNYDINGSSGLNGVPLYLYGSNVNLSAVPLPAAAWLFGSGLFGMASVARRRAA